MAHIAGLYQAYLYLYAKWRLLGPGLECKVLLWFSFCVFNCRTKVFAFKFIWILFWKLCVSLPSSLLSSGFTIKIPHSFRFYPHKATHSPKKAVQREIINVLAQSFLQPIASSLTSPCTLLWSSSSEGPTHQSFLHWQTKLRSHVTFSLDISGFGGLEVACWPLVPKFTGSHPAEAVGFLGRKNLQHAFLRRGSKAVGPMS